MHREPIACSRLGCPIEADSLTLCGASRVPTCWRHTAEYLDRYPEDADRVWPASLRGIPEGRATRQHRG